jgi:hypothetical protein
MQYFHFVRTFLSFRAEQLHPFAISRHVIIQSLPPTIHVLRWQISYRLDKLTESENEGRFEIPMSWLCTDLSFTRWRGQEYSCFLGLLEDILTNKTSFQLTSLTRAARIWLRTLDSERNSSHKFFPKLVIFGNKSQKTR